MPLVVNDEKVEARMEKVASGMATQPNKTRLALAVITRAVRMEPTELDRWLAGGPSPAVSKTSP